MCACVCVRACVGGWVGGWVGEWVGVGLFECVCVNNENDSVWNDSLN